MTLTVPARASRVFLVGGGALRVDLRGAYASDNEYKPSWSVGQEWKVEVEKLTEPRSLPDELLAGFEPRKVKVIYHFEVEGVREIDGEACSQIRIECVAVDGAVARDEVFYRVFMRQDSGTLKMVERLRRPNGNVEANRKFSSVPVDATDWVGFLPMGWPSFAVEQGKHVATIRRGAKGDVEFRDTDECSQRDQEITTGVAEKEEVVLRVTLEKTGDGGITWRTTQTWIKGMPWWVEASHERGDQQWCSARLVKE